MPGRPDNGRAGLLFTVDDATLNSLEYPAVLAELSGHTLTPVGRAEVRSTRPTTDLDTLKAAYSDYTELERFRAERGRKLPLGGVEDLRPLLEKARPEGTSLEPGELMMVRSTLDAAGDLRKLLGDDFAGAYPGLTARIEKISTQKMLTRELGRVFDDKGELVDDASGELYRIRSEMRASRERARSALDEMTRDERYREFLQEEIVTVRDDRFVLVVKSGKHTNIRGVVHGRSASGASFFVEPFRVVELNNKFSVFKREERAEELRILRMLTGWFLEAGPEILSDLDVMAGLDALQARVDFAAKVGALMPGMASSGAADLRGARHPLLVLKELGGGPPAIPVDVVLDEDARVLVVSGANTGGKTVALKTLGLLTLMALSAVPVPAEEGSTVLAFTDIFCDIGDSQDIQASLSTFSAHVSRLRGFLDEAGPGSLVLIDEIGAGTNPAEGGALALASIETLRERGARVVVTTHLNLLKARASTDPEYVNASVEFDEDTLKPLYRLNYGVPGASLGLFIARSLGIPPEVVDRAEGFLADSEAEFMESVKALEDERAEVEAMGERLAGLEAERDRAVAGLKADRERILERMREKVRKVASDAEAEIREARREMREARKKAGPLPTSTRVASVAREAEKRLGGGEKKKKPYRPAVGDYARIEGTGTRGDVMEVDEEGRKAELKVGTMKVWAPWARLEKVGGGVPGGKAGGKRGPGGGRKGDRGTQASGPGADIKVEAGATLNIIGRRVDEAEPEVTRFLDSAHASGLSRVEIIHGVGTGALKRAVREMVGRHPGVESFGEGDPDHGGAGLTVVEFK